MYVPYYILIVTAYVLKFQRDFKSIKNNEV